MVKYYFLDKKNVYQSFYNAPLTFGSFSSKKVVLFAKCFNFLTILVEKTEISGYIWHKSFIQMVKCSSFNQRIVYQSFTGVSLNLSYFFFKGKFCFGMHRQVTSEMICLWFEAFRPCWENDISGYIWHKPFIQMEKYSFPKERIVYQSFYGRCWRLVIFFFKE